jgi:ParB-like chromosome segregation protein Spo0J
MNRADQPRQIEMVPLRSLKPAERNARTHSKKQVEQVAHSMKRFGVINPLIVDTSQAVQS